jgi:putative CocE/NonD family hydrolase
VRQNEAYTEWWAPLEASGPYGNNLVNVDAPTMSQAGWHDIFLQGQIDSFDDTLTQVAGTDLASKMWLWIIPGGHCTGDEADFGYPKFESLQNFPYMATAMFKGDFDDPVFGYSGVYNVYVMGPVPLYMAESEKGTATGNYWASFDAWPAFEPTKWFLGADGVASLVAPDQAGGDVLATLRYDPADPTPATGANTLYSSTPCGPRDQAPVLARPDSLVWTAASPFAEATAIVGKVSATLTVSSSAVDTDFYVVLTDTYPDGGPTVNVRYGGAKMRWNTPGATPFVAENMEPGTTYEVEVDMWSTAYVFNPGHTLGVIVTSARFPEFAVNPNNGLPLADQADGPMVVANNTVHSAGAGLSFVTLPVVPLDAIPLNPNIR